jgi:hypothetical protein
MCDYFGLCMTVTTSNVVYWVDIAGDLLKFSTTWGRFRSVYTQVYTFAPCVSTIGYKLNRGIIHTASDHSGRHGNCGDRRKVHPCSIDLGGCVTDAQKSVLFMSTLNSVPLGIEFGESAIQLLASGFVEIHEALSIFLCFSSNCCAI